ncbi:hypothetical protein HanRHA438_Chr07g0295591 [Helianthus annuus]|nr:hypothetical protein HanRHA438_Chr07g0295591 [Helianthus annuus]
MNTHTLSLSLSQLSSLSFSIPHLQLFSTTTSPPSLPQPLVRMRTTNIFIITTARNHKALTIRNLNRITPNPSCFYSSSTNLYTDL